MMMNDDCHGTIGMVKTLTGRRDGAFTAGYNGDGNGTYASFLTSDALAANPAGIQSPYVVTKWRDHLFITDFGIRYDTRDA